MATARQKHIARKRRLGIGHKCRKRVLMPKAVSQPDHGLEGEEGYSNPKKEEKNALSTPSPPRRRGGQPGNSNRWVHGKYTAERQAFMDEVRAFLAKTKEDLAWVALLGAERRESLREWR